MKACGDENKDIRQENGKLEAENVELKQRMMNPLCFRCRNPSVPNHPMSAKWRLLNENARLNDEYVCAKAYLNKLMRDAAQRPPLMPFDSSCRTNLQATLVSHAERALKEFVMLATTDEPMWLPTSDGKMLNHQEYILQTFPGLLGLCPRGFVEEATRLTDLIKGTAMDLVSVLTDVVTDAYLQLHIQYIFQVYI